MTFVLWSPLDWFMENKLLHELMATHRAAHTPCRFAGLALNCLWKWCTVQSTGTHKITLFILPLSLRDEVFLIYFLSNMDFFQVPVKSRLRMCSLE